MESCKAAVGGVLFSRCVQYSRARIGEGGEVCFVVVECIEWSRGARLGWLRSGWAFGRNRRLDLTTLGAVKCGLREATCIGRMGGGGKREERVS